jgi:hypothetical protein
LPKQKIGFAFRYPGFKSKASGVIAKFLCLGVSQITEARLNGGVWIGADRAHNGAMPHDLGAMVMTDLPKYGGERSSKTLAPPRRPAS